MFPKLSIVLGGARSGKSAFAERLVQSGDGELVYIATAENRDNEMNDRIEAHRASRGPSWRTLEIPYEVGTALEALKPGENVLLDCATLWLSNHLGRDSDIVAETEALLAAMSESAANVVVVSNEVGMGIVPDNPLARRFRDLQGSLNQALATKADLVVFVVAGIPTVLKGQLPSGSL